MTEAALRRAVLRNIKQRYPQAWLYCPSDRWRSGVPDILCCISGHLYAWELKTARGIVSPIQAATLARIRRAGGRAMVMRRGEELSQFLQPQP